MLDTIGPWQLYRKSHRGCRVQWRFLPSTIPVAGLVCCLTVDFKKIRIDVTP